jgi:threonine-phosphate decarboxylase
LAPFRILIRRCHTFPGLDDFFIRLAVRSVEDNARLLSALEVVFSGE